MRVHRNLRWRIMKFTRSGSGVFTHAMHGRIYSHMTIEPSLQYRDGARWVFTDQGGIAGVNREAP